MSVVLRPKPPETVTLKEFLNLVEKYGWDEALKKAEEMTVTAVPKASASHELTPEEVEVCTDMLKKLRETGQIYIVDLDYPISITKPLFRLLDATRRKRAEKMGVPEVQYDIEAYIYDLLGLPRSARAGSKEVDNSHRETKHNPHSEGT